MRRVGTLILLAVLLEPGSARSAPPCQTPSPAPPLPDIRLVQIASGLSDPTHLAKATDGSGRRFVVERAGRIRAVRRREILPEDFLDISDRVASGGELGLLSVAFHPRFRDNGRFYVDYTTRVSGKLETFVSELTATPDLVRANPATERVLLRVRQPFENHNGGQLVFGPEGFLYVTMGDGGGSNDPKGKAQNLSSRHGKILRIDVDSRTGTKEYGIPPDNPFVGADGRDEIWAFGFRNPWRASFDALTGELWVGDVGQSAREEIDLVEPGRNYGWNVMEGSVCTPGVSRPDCDQTGLALPVFDYPTSEGCAVTGGFVYRGSKIPDLCGAYLYGDFCNGEIRAFRYQGGQVIEHRLLLDTDLLLSSFGGRRELFVVDLGGSIHKIRSID